MLEMKHYFDISGSIEIREVDIAGVACMYPGNKSQLKSLRWTHSRSFSNPEWQMN